MSKTDFILTAAALREHVSYDPLTGEFRYKNTHRRRCYLAGDTFGHPDEMGYRKVNIGGAKFRLHRLAWLYMTGEWPKNDIDHINGIRSDNRIANLRDVPRSMNLQNSKHKKLGATGLAGVTIKRNTFTTKYLAQIKANGKWNNLGRYDTPEEAHEAYMAAKRKLHPGWVDV